jgi:hypothetical protein
LTDENNITVSIPYESSQKDFVLLAPINNVILKVAPNVSQIKGLNLTLLNSASEEVDESKHPNITLDDSWSSNILFQGNTSLSLQNDKALSYSLRNDQNISILITHPPPPEDSIYPSYSSDLSVDDTSYTWIIILSIAVGLFIIVALIILISILKNRTVKDEYNGFK